MVTQTLKVLVTYNCCNANNQLVFAAYMDAVTARQQQNCRDPVAVTEPRRSRKYKMCGTSRYKRL